MSFEARATPYPTVGMIAVLKGGGRVAVWPAENDDADCFTGQLLEPGASAARIAVHNVSTLWLRGSIARVEPPTDADHRLSLLTLAELANG